MAEKLKKIAIFDVDGTIFRSSLLIEVVDELVREKIFKPGVVKIYERAHEDWQNREGSYENYIRRVIKAFEDNISGVSYADFRKIAYKVVARHKNRTYKFTRDLVKTLKEKGYYILAISHSPKLIVEPFCKTLGFTKVYGIMYAADTAGKFTSEKLYSDIIFDKAKVLERAVAKGGLTLKGSIGVGDTESDIVFLKMVEHPICFNPASALYKYAKKQKWEIVVERKDVVYKI